MVHSLVVVPEPMPKFATLQVPLFLLASTITERDKQNWIFSSPLCGSFLFIIGLTVLSSVESANDGRSHIAGAAEGERVRGAVADAPAVGRDGVRRVGDRPDLGARDAEGLRICEPRFVSWITIELDIYEREIPCLGGREETITQ